MYTYKKNIFTKNVKCLLTKKVKDYRVKMVVRQIKYCSNLDLSILLAKY